MSAAKGAFCKFPGIVEGGIRFRGVNSLSVLSYSVGWFESTADTLIVSDGEIISAA